MAQNDKTGSDLDIFEDLGKRPPSAFPSNGSRSVPPPPPGVQGKRTLLGVSAPSTIATLPPPPPSPSRIPPPPPGRSSLPPVVAARSSGLPPPPVEAVAKHAANPAVDMDWDEEDEATHIFDEQNESTKIFDDEANEETKVVDEFAAAAAAVHAASIPKAKVTLVGLSAPPPPPVVSSIPPPNVAARPATSRPPPPPPPGSAVGPFARPSGFPAARPSGRPGVPSGFPPPPSINPFPPPIATQPGLGTMPPSRSSHSGAPLGHLPIPRPAPVPDFLSGHSGHRRMLEATAMVRPPKNRTALFAACGAAGIVVIVGLLLWPSHPGRIVVNVADSQGSAVNRLEVFIDGRKQCDTAPCVIDQVSSGPHDVKVLANGYDAPAVQAVDVESHKDSTANFTLGSSGGTGIRVGGTQPGVKLYVDDKESGPLPQELRDLNPGDHLIKVAGSERYQPLEKHVTVERQKIQDLGTVTLKVLKGKATISLGTPGARVFLVSGADRRELPVLPISVDIDTTKTWALEANRPGFMDYRQPIGFDDGQAERSYVVSLDAKPAGGWASSVSYSPAPVAAMRPVAHVEHTERTETAAAQPEAAGGGGDGAEAFLNINSIPPSTCFLDGRSLGSTPKVHITVKPGAHTVKFVNSDEGLTKTVSVSVGAGETKPAVAKLN
jgi:hypothetical protein